MKTPLYRSLRRKIIGITLFVSLAPLIILGLTIHYQFARVYGQKIEEQIRYRSQAQARAIDLFLNERIAVLGTMADTHSLEELLEERVLTRAFEVLNSRAGALVDLGVIDHEGRQQAYAGPYDLKGRDYRDQAWFAEVKGKGVHVSDVFLGFREFPHFIIAVRRQDGRRTWILRATIDSDVFRNLVLAAQVGRSGDAYLINVEGQYQTRPRFGGEIMGGSGLDPSQFGGTTTLTELRDERGRELLCAGTRLEGKNWVLVITQDAGEELGAIFATRNVDIAIVCLGILAIVLMTFFTTHVTVQRMQLAAQEMDALNVQLVQSDKLAALGKMAAGVAHEINNPLAVILQKTGWMEDLLEDEGFKGSESFEEYRTSLKKIEEHVERARKIVHAMLGYARRMEPRLQDVDVNEVLRQTVELLDNYARISNIEIVSDFAKDIPIIASDQAELQQVFLNLISNAIDAIGNEGHVTITTRMVAEQIEIAIADDGPGVPPAMRGRVFDPFFTTKEAGKGTGLGLWISYNIVDKMGGTITVESEVGKGSTFTVTIPVRLPEKK